MPGSARQQLVFIFSPDQTFFSYGMTAELEGLFLVTGTWSVVDSDLTGSFIQIDPPITNAVFNFTGKVTAERMRMKVSGPGPDFRIKCKPLVGAPSVLGDWSVETRSGTNFASAVSVTVSNGLPHLFRVAETTPTNNVTGVMMVNAKGQALAFVKANAGGFNARLRGKFRRNQTAARFNGTDSRGKNVKQDWELLPP